MSWVFFFIPEMKDFLRRIINDDVSDLSEESLLSLKDASLARLALFSRSRGEGGRGGRRGRRRKKRKENEEEENKIEVKDYATGECGGRERGVTAMEERNRPKLQPHIHVNAVQ